MRRTIAGDPDVVLALHVGGPRSGVQVLCPVDLHVHPELREVRVQVARTAAHVPSLHLELRFGQAVPSAQFDEPDLGRAGRTQLGQIQRPGDQSVSAAVRKPVGDCAYLAGQDEALLASGGQDRDRVLVAERPHRRVQQRPGHAGPVGPADLAVADRQRGCAVNLDGGHVQRHPA
ncbi:hypothetical protein AB0M47_31255 [Hamadaea sp. NPDC051192]|uniref:hypothetical protein n=1 Tax=Hamadaea sp. NPDC051192 TaxID=3154940 RepID=UPI00342C5FE8